MNVNSVMGVSRVLTQVEFEERFGVYLSSLNYNSFMCIINEALRSQPDCVWNNKFGSFHKFISGTKGTHPSEGYSHTVWVANVSTLKVVSKWQGKVIYTNEHKTLV